MTRYFLDLNNNTIIPEGWINPFSPSSRYIHLDEYQIRKLIDWVREDELNGMLSDCRYNKEIKADNKCACYDCKWLHIEGLSHCTIHEGCWGDCKCADFETRG